MKKTLWALGAIAVVMLGFPWAVATFVPHDGGMAACFVLFFGVNAMWGLYVGIYAGLAVKQRWFLPFANATAYLMGVWSVFDWGNPDFYGFAIAYLVLALLTMLITVVVVRNVKKELHNG